ncbi:hypothetical protein V2I01_23630 [Micromonospora sp. BRA006-A]|nr:hypothetical protein [Micromonospora sp. BRA006-A]
MLVLLIVHLVAALLAPLLVRRWGPRACLLLALAPAATAVWAAGAPGRYATAAKWSRRTSGSRSSSSTWRCASRRCPG